MRVPPTPWLCGPWPTGSEGEDVHRRGRPDGLAVLSLKSCFVKPLAAAPISYGAPLAVPRIAPDSYVLSTYVWTA
ncbi:hypothetical protein GCM10010350_79380 [Streptomyces galilaeus]|nr:hypothetical protein GCM10010350_79380 [Streptomyces galilaeus]